MLDLLPNVEREKKPWLLEGANWIQEPQVMSMETFYKEFLGVDIEAEKKALRQELENEHVQLPRRGPEGPEAGAGSPDLGGSPVDVDPPAGVVRRQGLRHHRHRRYYCFRRLLAL